MNPLCRVREGVVGALTGAAGPGELVAALFAMTRSLAIFGDSLMDAGNLDQVASIVRQNPFQDPIYSRGGNVKASDGSVFGEHIAEQLGASLGSRQLANLITLPTLRFTGFGSKQLRNYSYAGATSGFAGSRRSGLSRFPIGLRAQARAFAASTSRTQDLDALLTVGSNEITDLVADPDPLKVFLASPSRRDDLQFEMKAARRIVNNIVEAYDVITGLVDETVIVGLAPLSATPYVADQAMGMNASLREPLLDLVDGIAGRVNQVLARRLDARPDVLVVDGFELWRSVSNPMFLDDVHPTSATGQSLAGAVAGLIQASDLQSYGFT